MIVVASLSLFAIGRERALRITHRLATEDPLTGLLNRREFVRRAEALSQGITKRQSDYALLLFDLDHFKSINDTHGHLVGDDVIIAFARVARAALREQDLICRYGGEEFAALLPGTSAADAFSLAERLRRDLAVSGEDVLARLRPTTSVGIVSIRSAAVPVLDLLRQVDEALYRAKGEGRDRSVVFSGNPALTPLRIVRSAGIV